MSIIIKEDGYTDTSATKYVIPDFKHVAYNDYKIRIPRRLLGLKHNIIHEIVHFLQENTVEEDQKYISYDGSNYFEYVSQKSEQEAHYVQILYIYKFESKTLKLKENIIDEFDRKIKESYIDKNSIIDLILFSKFNGIICSNLHKNSVSI